MPGMPFGVTGQSGQSELHTVGGHRPGGPSIAEPGGSDRQRPAPQLQRGWRGRSLDSESPSLQLVWSATATELQQSNRAATELQQQSLDSESATRMVGLDGGHWGGRRDARREAKCGRFPKEHPLHGSRCESNRCELGVERAVVGREEKEAAAQASCGASTLGRTPAVSRHGETHAHSGRMGWALSVVCDTDAAARREWGTVSLNCSHWHNGAHNCPSESGAYAEWRIRGQGGRPCIRAIRGETKPATKRSGA